MLGRPRKLPSASELFRLLATGKYKSQREIATAYGVSESAVSHALSPLKEDKIDFRSLLLWDVRPEHMSNPRQARALRLHLRAKVENHTLSAKEEAEHEKWLTSLKGLTLDYSRDVGWVYLSRTPEHGDYVARIPEGIGIPREKIDLYRM